MTKKILIDARMASLKHTGIGRYVLNLLSAIKEQIKNYPFDFNLIVNKDCLPEIKKEFGNSFKYFPATSWHYSLKEQIEIPLIIKKIKPDLVHFPHFNVPVWTSKNYIVTIHDLIKHFSKGKETTTRSRTVYWLKYLIYLLVFKLTVKRAKKIIVPSKWVRQQLIQNYSFTQNKVIVIYEGVGNKIRPVKPKFLQKTLAKYQITLPYIVYVGSLYPHKNVFTLLWAIKIFNQKFSPQIKLVIVSARNIFFKRIQKQIDQLKIQEKVILTGFVDDKELAALYQKALAFVFPSLMEGFGLPGLEAMVCGCPVIASNSSCLSEIYHQAALYFDPSDPKAISLKIKQLMDNPQLRKKLIARGYKRVKNFSWRKNALETLKIYQQVLIQDEKNCPCL